MNFGTHEEGIGFDLSIGIPKIFPVAHRKNYGVTKFKGSYGDYEGWQIRSGKETTFFMLFTKGETKYSAGELSQTTGYIILGMPGNFSIEVSNDLFGDGGDRYRSAYQRINLFGGFVRIGNKMFTGDPGLYEYQRSTDIINDRETYIR